MDSEGILHVSSESTEENERSNLQARIKRTVNQYNFLKLPYYVLCIIGLVPFQIQPLTSLKSINIIYPMVILSFISLAYGMQIAAMIIGKRNYELPFSLYFMIAILIFEPSNRILEYILFHALWTNCP